VLLELGLVHPPNIGEGQARDGTPRPPQDLVAARPSRTI